MRQNQCQVRRQPAIDCRSPGQAGWGLGVFLIAWLLFPFAGVTREGNAADRAAIAELRAGKRGMANAAWWGFDKEDATEALQAALDSGARRLLIPYQGQPWLVRPLRLSSNQEIVLEPGVVLQAKQGEFQGTADSLLSAVGQSNLVIRGYGACLRMRKQDYQNPPYKKGEWRMGIALRGCRHVLLEGIRVESSGGDGFYIDGGGQRDWSEDITLRNCTAENNHRQGLSVISVVNLLVENCRFSNTWGTAPEAGIDLEPDTEKERLVNCVIRNCTFENNNGHQILVYLKPLTTNSQPVSIRFENCLARMSDGAWQEARLGSKTGLKGEAGIAVGEIKDNGPGGSVEFFRCVVENTAKESVRLYDKAATAARVRLVDCALSKPWRLPEIKVTGRAPILLQVRHPESTSKPGGIDIVDCRLYDCGDGPALIFEGGKSNAVWRDVHGRIIESERNRPALQLGPELRAVDLQVVEPTAGSGP
jgi:hypothetical protein